MKYLANVVGIDNARDLLERIPNKITDTMGIIADVNLLYKGELEYLQIIVLCNIACCGLDTADERFVIVINSIVQ